MSTWKEDFNEVASGFQKNGKPRSWVVILVGALVFIFIIVALLSFGGFFKQGTKTPKATPSAVATIAPAAPEKTLSEKVRATISREWRSAAIPGCKESYTTGLGSDENLAQFIAGSLKSLESAKFSATSTDSSITVQGDSESLSIRGANNALVLCVTSKK